MNLDTIFFISLGIVIAGVVAVIILVATSDFEKKKGKKDLEEYKKDYIDNIPDMGLKIMATNLLELKEYYIMTKIQYNRTFILTATFSSIGCIIILMGSVYGAFNQDFTITKYTTVAGIVSEGVAGLAFWMFNQAKNQLNLYANHLRDNEKVLCAINILEKMDTDEKSKNISRIICYLLKSDEN